MPEVELLLGPVTQPRVQKIIHRSIFLVAELAFSESAQCVIMFFTFLFLFLVCTIFFFIELSFTER